MKPIYAAAVEKHKTLILDAFDYIWKHPETGFREVKTTKYLRDAFEALGYDVISAEDITGFYTVLDTGREGPEVLVLGELDALICSSHPDADPETGAVHCCGHAVQTSALLGLAAALKEPGVLDDLCGRIRLCTVPAEELIELEFRMKLMSEGKLRHLGGKTEFLERGYFDGVDLALMVHAATENTLLVRAGSVGSIKKIAVYKGTSAHAGAAPWKGCNALYAATQGLSAINAIRETFKEADIIRVHPIITKGGEAVNAIPDCVVIENQVRGKTFGAMFDVNKRVNRALCGAALSLGANVDIQDIPGYAPLTNDPGLIEVMRDAAAILPDEKFEYNPVPSSGSTDMGELSCIMPVVHPYIPGATGHGHGSDYSIKNPERTCVGSAKWQLAALALLLENNAARAKKIVAEYRPQFASKTDFLNHIKSIACSGDRITYGETTAEVKL